MIEIRTEIIIATHYPFKQNEHNIFFHCFISISKCSTSDETEVSLRLAHHIATIFCNFQQNE